MPTVILTRVVDNEYRPNVFVRNWDISNIIPWSIIDVR